MNSKEIRVLDKSVADKIAAGEVIERPASIVKELMENSIDAGASVITCEIKKGGKEYIRVTDNGTGIPENQILTAFKRHATSKITSADDLKAIHTLGFRGEALASIAAVSRVELITKEAEPALGKRVIIHGGQVVEESVTGCPDGTTIIVSDLFYNTPARKKFLKSDGAESGIIIDLMERLAVTRPDISFRLINNGNSVFSTKGDGDLLKAIVNVYKDRDYPNLVRIDEERDGMRVYGYVSRPQVNRTNRRSQYFFVNGRVVRSGILEKALMSGYKERLFEGRYPIAFLYLDMDPSSLDVNIHPNKREVWFTDEIQVSTVVRDAVVNALNKGIAAAKPLFKEENISSSLKLEEDIPIYSGEEDDAVEEAQEEVIEEVQEDISKLFATKRYEAENTDIVYDKTVQDDYVENSPFNFNGLIFGEALFDTYITATDEDSFYLFDQHACHERINYERFLEVYNSQEKPRQILMIPFTVDIPGGVAQSDAEWLDLLEKIGFFAERFGDNTYIVREVPQFLTLAEAQDFIKSFTDAYYEGGTVTHPDIDRLITRSCKSSVKAHDSLNSEEIRELMRQLKGCRNPFSCPHGRPTFVRFTIRDIEKMFKRIL